MKIENFKNLWKNDIVKFVIDGREDYDKAVEVLKEVGIKDFVRKAFSPTPNLSSKVLVDWMKQDKLFQVIVSLQLHKIIWPDANLEEV